MGGGGNAPIRKMIWSLMGYINVVSVNYWRRRNGRQMDFTEGSARDVRFLDMLLNLERIGALVEMGANSPYWAKIGESKEM